MKYLFFFISIGCLYACDMISRQKKDKPEASSDGLTISVKKNKDTVIHTTKTDSLNKQVTLVEIKPYRKQATPVSATKPKAVLNKASYLSLPEGTPATYKNISNLVIENLQFTNKSGANLVFINCKDITIRNCYFGRSGAEAIVLEKCSGILVENAYSPTT